LASLAPRPLPPPVVMSRLSTATVPVINPGVDVSPVRPTESDRLSVPLVRKAFDLPPLNESASGARILASGRNRRRANDATREEDFGGADHREAA
jgi:hypothetical protein